MNTLKLSTTCKECPLSKDAGLGRDRLICTRTGEVVRSHWTAVLDCEDEEGRGTGRLGRLLRPLLNQYGVGLSGCDRIEFELGLREGILRKEKNSDFLPNSEYYAGFDIGLSW